MEKIYVGIGRITASAPAQFSIYTKHFIYNPFVNPVTYNFFIYKILENKKTAETFPIPQGNTTCINSISIVSGSGPPVNNFIYNVENSYRFNPLSIGANNGF
jgi:hypothetical protein